MYQSQATHLLKLRIIHIRIYIKYKGASNDCMSLLNQMRNSTKSVKSPTYHYVASSKEAYSVILKDHPLDIMIMHQKACYNISIA
ncbi:unnamed protein product [Alternaria burnsii]|nr:unnamed protein product [Alternaria burnsii]